MVSNGGCVFGERSFVDVIIEGITFLLRIICFLVVEDVSNILDSSRGT